MKLHYSPTSPFVRKVLVVAHERGMAECIELTSTSGELLSDNPLEKVPALALDDGRTLFDSFVIVEWLNSQGAGPNLIPADAEKRTNVLRRHALADGIMEAAVSSVMERRRPEDKQWDGFLKRQRGKIERAIATLDSGTMGETVDLSTISVGVALGYVEFRLAGLDWRSGHGPLADWFDTFSRRPSMASTAPQDPRPMRPSARRSSLMA